MDSARRAPEAAERVFSDEDGLGDNAGPGPFPPPPRTSPEVAAASEVVRPLAAADAGARPQGGPCWRTAGAGAGSAVVGAGAASGGAEAAAGAGVATSAPGAAGAAAEEAAGAAGAAAGAATAAPAAAAEAPDAPGKRNVEQLAEETLRRTWNSFLYISGSR